MVNAQYGKPQYGKPQYGKPQYGKLQYGKVQCGKSQYGKPQYGKFTLFEQFYTIQTIISLFFKLSYNVPSSIFMFSKLCYFICFPCFIYLMLLVILMTINILYSNYKQTYYFTIIRYFTLHLIESTSIFIIVKTAYSISSALEHI